jgi:4a-hydroxytetrahydrobiopterin dehydratase
MSDLAERKCVPCEGGVEPASDDEIAGLRRQVPDWKVIEVDGVKRLERKFFFPDFATALDFTNRVGALAEAEGHHPMLTTEWAKVTVTWWTHAIGGLHENDFVMAAKADRAHAALGA